MLTTATSADDNSEALESPTEESVSEAGNEAVPADAGIPEPEIRAKGKPSRPRPKRDYNYFADLRTAVAELQNAERSLPADDELG
jgi:hypothetical protein